MANSSSGEFEPRSWGVEQDCKVAFDVLPKPIVVFTPAGQIVYGNRWAHAMSGYDEEELASRHASELLPEIIPAPSGEGLREAVRQDTTCFETVLQTKSGQAVPCLFESFRLNHREEALICGIFRDVTEWQEAQEVLRESEHRYHQLFEQAQEGIAISIFEGEILDMNPAGCRIFGREREEIIGRNAREFYAEATDRSAILEEIEASEDGRSREIRFRRPGGEQITCQISATPIRGPEEEVQAYQTFFRDVTEQREAEERLRRSERRYRRLFEDSRDAVVLATPDGAIIDANSSAEELFGYSHDELLSMNAAELYATPEERSRRILPELEEASDSRLFEVELRRRGGDTFPATTSMTVHRDEDGQPELIQGHVRDVTEWRGLQEKVLQVQDRERQRLGQELHDGVCSILTGTALLTSSLASEIRADKDIDPADLDKATELAQQAAEEARAISHGLTPVGLERGLRAALDDLVSQTEVRGEIECSLEISGSVWDLSDETATHLFRIAQEAANNAAKHAEAQNVQLQLAAEGEDALTLTVRDDGQGYSGSSSGSEGIGLRTMRCRADLIGASLTIEEAPGGGMLIRCSLPLEKGSKQPE